MQMVVEVLIAVLQAGPEVLVAEAQGPNLQHRQPLVLGKLILEAEAAVGTTYQRALLARVVLAL